MRLRLAPWMLCLVCLLTWAPEARAAERLPTIRIATVADGPSRHLTDIGKMFEREINDLMRGDVIVEFPANKQLDGSWSLEGIKGTIDHVLADPKVDLLITLGVIASNDVALRKRLPKPTIAPFIISQELQGLPLKKGATGVRNLTYLAPVRELGHKVKMFKDIMPFRNLVILGDRLILKAFPFLRKNLRRIARANEVRIKLIPVDTTIRPSLKAIPKETEAVMVVPLLRLPEPEFTLLVRGLIARRLPSFSIIGRKEVERGLLATGTPDTDYVRLARRVALTVQRIKLGRNAGRLPVHVEVREQLTINMATARAIDRYPSFRVLTEAVLLNEEIQKAARRLSLYRVVREAVGVNPDLAAADRKVAAGLGQVYQARAALLPQLDIGLRGTEISPNLASNLLGGIPERFLNARGSASQLIYSDDAWSNLTVQKRTQVSREEERNQLRLDTAQQAATSYLNILRTNAILHIQRDNLRLTRSNLELARLRESVGYAARDEVFRWESEVANSRIRVLDAQAQLRQTRVLVNRILYRPLEQPFTTEEADLNDPLLLIGEKRLFAYVDNPRNFRVFRDFQVQEGLKASPELRRLDALIAAQERKVLNAQRAYWAPNASFKADVFQRLANDGGGGGNVVPPIGVVPQQGGDVNNFWFLQLGLDFPLYQGGSKDATQVKESEELRRIRLERAATVGRIEERIRSALYAASASFPSIRLSREASEASKKNLDLVRDQYSRGAVDITKLINAQFAAVEARQNAANAVYRFLIDVTDIQRAVGRFDYFTYREEREAWYRRLQAFFAKSGVKPPRIQR